MQQTVVWNMSWSSAFKRRHMRRSERAAAPHIAPPKGRNSNGCSPITVWVGPTIKLSLELA
jgi:hypothetical protein